MNNVFANFSGADYINGACLTIENAERHLKTSKIISDEKLYGIAISHLILAAEEYIKSFILLCLNGDENFINDTEKIELFKNHKFKHRHIALFLKSISDTATQKFDDELFDRFVNNKAPESNYSLNGFYINRVFQFINLSDEKLKLLEKWLIKANDLKNNGFYLGVDEDWKSPETFTDADYQEAFELVNYLKNSIKPLFEMPLTDEQFIDFLNGG